MTDTSLDLVSLDVLEIEESLREYMRSQPLFADYLYEGSNLSALIRIMALNTHKNAFFLNMVHSEGFLDSAQTRASVVSHAKDLNYCPRSSRSARATIRLSFRGTEPTYTVAKGSTFSAIVDNRSLVFSVPETVLLTGRSGSFTGEFDIYEGTYVTDLYVMDSSDETQRFLLTNPGVDTGSITVVVNEDGSLSGQTYTRATSLLGLDSTSRVYFVQASSGGRYEVVFGDNLVGRRPSDSSSVSIDYRVSSGRDGNGARAFSRDFSIGTGVDSAELDVLQPSLGGDGAESIESIRYYAPRHFQTQERAVTASDYVTLLKTQFPEIRSAAAYGGEEVSPPQYGKVIIAIDVADVDGIPRSLRDKYTKFLRSRSSLTIDPIFVEPEFIYLEVSTEVSYGVNRTTIPPTGIELIVKTAIVDWAERNLNDFDSSFRFSNLVSLIDQSHPSVVGNRTRVRMYKRIRGDQFGQTSIPLRFGVPIKREPEVRASFPARYQRGLTSSRFVVDGETRFLVDDGAGAVWVAATRGSSTIMLRRAGSVDYTSGLVSLGTLDIDSFDGDTLRVFCVPALEQDVDARRDTILSIEAGDVDVQGVPVRE